MLAGQDNNHAVQSPTFSNSTNEQAASDQAHWADLAQPTSRDSFCSSWLALQCGLIAHASAGMVLLGKPDAGPYTPVAVWPDPRRNLSKLSPAAEQALCERRGVLIRATDETASAQVAYPLEIAGRIHGVVVLDVASSDEPQLRKVLTALHWGAGRLERAREDSARMRRLSIAGANLDLIAVIGEHGEFTPAARAFVTEMASRLACDRVSVGLRKQNHIEVVAISHSANFKEKANLVRAIGAVMDEAHDQKAVVLYPEHKTDKQPRITRYAAELVQHNGGGSVCALPLFDHAEPAGALVLESSAEDRFDASTIEFCKTIASLTGPILSLHHREERGIVSRIFTGARGWLDRMFGPRHFGLKIGAVFSVLLTTILVFATGEYRITADAALEGSTLRAAVSPFDGYIENSVVRAGDVVHAGQVLCELNDRDLAVERQKWLSRRLQYARNCVRPGKTRVVWCRYPDCPEQAGGGRAGAALETNSREPGSPHLSTVSWRPATSARRLVAR
jgi:hypothetical protein